MRLPEEVYRAGTGGAPKAEEELTHEERRRRRAQHKRAFKAKSQQQVLCKLKQGSVYGGCWAECSWLVLACARRHGALTDCCLSGHHSAHVTQAMKRSLLEVPPSDALWRAVCGVLSSKISCCHSQRSSFSSEMGQQAFLRCPAP